MRPSPTNFRSSPPPLSSSFSSTASCLRSFKSPIPYLFGGLGFTLVLIALALLMLACSNRRRPSPSPSSNPSGCDDEESKLEVAKTTSDSEPRVLVIMAGQSNPTYLAKPLSSSSSPTTTATEQPL